MQSSFHQPTPFNIVAHQLYLNRIIIVGFFSLVVGTRYRPFLIAPIIIIIIIIIATVPFFYL
jgi:hypothetical protein